MPSRGTFGVALTVLVLLSGVEAAGAASRLPVTKAYAAAAELFKEGKVREARSAWAKLLDERLDELSPAQTAALEGRLAQCDEALGGAKRPPPPPTPLTEAEYAEICQDLRDGLLPEALALIKSAQKGSPRDPRVWNLLGEYHWRKKEPGECIKAWRKSLELDPKQPRMHDALARALLGRRTDAAESEAVAHAELAIGDNLALADQYAKLFRRSDLRERFDAKAAELRTNAALARAGVGPGVDRFGPKVTTPGGGGSGPAPAPSPCVITK